MKQVEAKKTTLRSLDYTDQKNDYTDFALFPIPF
jgi:hypothetical protein